MMIIILWTILLGLFLGWRLLSTRYHLPCPAFLARIIAMENPLAKENQAAQIMARLSLQDDMVVGDIGCGPGRVMKALVQTNKRISFVAVDGQDKMLMQARKVCGDTVTYQHGWVGRGVLSPCTYDLLLLVNVIGEIPEFHIAIHEIVEALKKGGILVVVETVFDPHYQRRQTLDASMLSAGLVVKEAFGHWWSYSVHYQKI